MGPIDSNYPGRWYHPPGMAVHKISYRIPVELSCSHCTLQWFWPTANSKAYDVPSYSCYGKQLKAAGWNVFDFCGWACSDDKCPSPYVVNTDAPRAPDPAKTSGFEEFRNCADIQVRSGGSAPAPTPTAQPPTTPVGSPTPRPTPMPPFVSSPTPTPQGSSCSGEPCADVSHCRSKWGYCGSSTAHCNADSTWKASGCSGDTPEPESEPEPEPEPAPEPESEPASCVPIGNCGQLTWCKQEEYIAWCSAAGNGGSCPSPFCTSQAPTGLVQVTREKRLRVAKRHSILAKETMLCQNTLGLARASGNEEVRDEEDEQVFHEEVCDKPGQKISPDLK